MLAKANLKLRPVNQTSTPSPWMSSQPLDSLAPPSYPPTPTPEHAHKSHLSFPPAVSHTVSQSLPPPLCDAATTPPPLPTANTLTADWSFQVTSGLFPCPLNITGWLRPRNPAWAREGVEVHPHTHTNTNTRAHKVCAVFYTQGRRVRPVPRFAPCSAQRISAHPLVIHGGVVCVRIHICCWICIGQVDINARKLHLYSCSGHEDYCFFSLLINS